MLLGTDCFWNLLCIGQLKVNQNRITMQKTKLGWVAVGPMRDVYFNSVKCNLHRSIDIDKSLTKFWEIEVGTSKVASNEERECEDHFRKHTYRNKDGRFVVSIPLKRDSNELGESERTAHKRLISLEKRLSRDLLLKEQYTAFLAEYERLGHMQKVVEETEPKNSYYLSHHCVVKADSLTTKIRVVFDASASIDNGVSLNDLQMIGPMHQDDLFTLLVRFRIHPYAISADIQQMYRQVLVNPDQWSLQRILWYTSEGGPIQKFELNTLTYGTLSAPFLATKCLIELANQVEGQFPLIAKIIRKDFYVDDLLTGGKTIEEAVEIQQKVAHILSSAGFQLWKWASNEPAVIRNIPREDHVVLISILTVTPKR